VCVCVCGVARERESEAVNKKQNGSGKKLSVSERAVRGWIREGEASGGEKNVTEAEKFC
jgi:hypothetical protein